MVVRARGEGARQRPSEGDGRLGGLFLLADPIRDTGLDGALEGEEAVLVRCFTSPEVIIMLHPLVTFRLFWLLG